MTAHATDHSYPDSGSASSQGEQQEAREAAEVSGVVVEAIAGWQMQADHVTLFQHQDHTSGHGSVTAVVVQAQVEEDRLTVAVQVEARVSFEVISGCEAEEVKSSDRSRERA